MKAPVEFVNAVKALPFPPADVEQFWSVWQRLSVERRLPRLVLDLLRRVYPGFLASRIFGGVAAIISDDYVRQFVPDVLLFPGRDRPDPTAPLVVWLRSGAGYLAEPIPLKEITGTVKEEIGQ